MAKYTLNCGQVKRLVVVQPNRISSDGLEEHAHITHFSGNEKADYFSEKSLPPE